MFRDKMIESELDSGRVRNSFEDLNPVILEYANIIETLKEELNICKKDQIQLRNELETLRVESKDAGNLVKECFARCNTETHDEALLHPEIMENLEKQIAVLQMEKDSMFQLWQMALKAIDVLEEELKTHQNDGKSSKSCDEQLNIVKQSYSDAINVLEGKLIQAKENFMKHQSLWESSREKLEEMKRERDDLKHQMDLREREDLERERSSRKTIETLNGELEKVKLELWNSNKTKLELEQRLIGAERFANNVLLKDSEAKNKVSEAIELVESAVREKELSLQREARITEEKFMLESRLANITDEYKSSLEKEVAKIREGHERNIKRYSLELKELKSVLREKETLLDRVQRECRLLDEEMNKVRLGSDNRSVQYNLKIQDLEQKLNNANEKLQIYEESCRKRYDEKNRILEQRVFELEGKLLISNEKYQRSQSSNFRDIEDRIREADDRTREVMNRYSNLEKRFTRVLDEKDDLLVELRSLQSMFDRGVKNMAQAKKSDENVDDNQKNANVTVHPELNIERIKEKCETKVRELSYLVEVHQKISSRWRDEVKLLTDKFQKRSTELRNKISALRKENEELNRELLLCRQKLTRYRVEAVHRSDHGNGER